MTNKPMILKPYHSNQPVLKRNETRSVAKGNYFKFNWIGWAWVITVLLSEADGISYELRTVSVVLEFYREAPEFELLMEALKIQF